MDHRKAFPAAAARLSRACQPAALQPDCRKTEELTRRFVATRHAPAYDEHASSQPSSSLAVMMRCKILNRPKSSPLMCHWGGVGVVFLKA
jgi:hypothetical protein